MSTKTRVYNLLKIAKAKITQLDYAILIFLKVKKNVSIPLADGTNLRVDVFTPRGKGPWPVIVSAYPYQKDGMAGIFSSMEAYYLLKAGYAVVLADIRGTGASDGVSQDLFDSLRGDDLYALVEWSASQKWSSGKVGMEGISYGGLTALRTAAENPPSLRAVYATMAPISFYDNIAFPGGSLSMLGVAGSWLNFINLINLFPPLYTKNRPDWRVVWKERLEAYTSYLLNSGDNVTYGEYWQKNEVQVENIKVPTYILEGWRGFSHRDSFQLYERLQAPKKLVIGPWVHVWPSFALVEPIHYIHEMIRWFDYWLKDNDTGIMKEPPLAIYVMGGNFWKYDDEWPPAHTNERHYYLHHDGSLGTEADTGEQTIRYTHDPEVGTAAGLMSLYPLGIDYPREQSEDNLRSLTFDTPALPDTVEIVGQPLLTLTMSTDMPDAAITAKLCDVAPEGQSTLITYGWLRMSRRDGLERPIEVQPGKAYEIHLKLWPADYQLQVGHRLRFCLALSDFPHIFPLPYKGNIFLSFGSSSTEKLVLNTLPSGARARAHPAFMPPDLSLLQGQKPATVEWEVRREEGAGQLIVHSGTEAEWPIPHLGSPLKIRHFFDATLIEGQPDTAVLDAAARAEFTMAKHRYVFTARQIVKFDGAEIAVKVEEDGDVLYDKIVTKVLDWASLDAK